MGWCWVYDPPAFASLRVPLLLTQKGEGSLPLPTPAEDKPCPATLGIPRSLASLVRAPFRFTKGAEVNGWFRRRRRRRW